MPGPTKPTRAPTDPDPHKPPEPMRPDPTKEPVPPPEEQPEPKIDPPSGPSEPPPKWVIFIYSGCSLPPVSPFV
jgi:hypothetical protein